MRLKDPINCDDDILNVILEQNLRQTTKELAERLITSQAIVYRHLENLGKVSKIMNMGTTSH
jgi:predicted transcriptional regulator